ncbi:MAG: hypothetical protein ACTS6A_01305 [Candidatus Hodgkinia cicadicola]
MPAHYCCWLALLFHRTPSSRSERANKLPRGQFPSTGGSNEIYIVSPFNETRRSVRP